MRCRFWCRGRTPVNRSVMPCVTRRTMGAWLKRLTLEAPEVSVQMFIDTRKLIIQGFVYGWYYLSTIFGCHGRSLTKLGYIFPHIQLGLK